MGLTWFKKQKIHKYTAIYEELMKEGDTQAAVGIYEKKLIEFEPYLDKSFRATYHLYRWIIFKNIEDYNAAKILANFQAGNSPLYITFATIQRMHLQLELAEAIRKNETEKSGFRESFMLLRNINPSEQLALSIFETLVAQNKSYDSNETNLAYNSILNSLPQKSSLQGETLQKIRDTIFVLANINSNQYETLYNEIDTLDLTGIDKDRIKCNILYKWIKQELMYGDIDKAFFVINILKQFTSAETFSLLFIKIGLETFRINAETTGKFLNSYLESIDNEKNIDLCNTLKAFLATIYFEQKKYSNARGLLHEINKEVIRNKTLPFKFISGQSGKNEILFFLYYLEADSYIAETVQWPLTQNSDNSDLKDGTSFKNLSMWRESLSEIHLLIQKMDELNTPLSWLANFLKGLVLFSDNKAMLSYEQLKQFSVSIESFNGEKLIAKLKSIEGSLQIRLKATDEAVKLIRNNDFTKLREFYDNVLITIEDSMPPYLRAGIYLMLWMSDKKFDALGKLTTVQASPDEEDLLNDCVKQVQAYLAIQRLLHECNSLEPLKENLPSLNILDFDINIHFLGSLTTALIYLKNNKNAEALTVVCSIESSDNPRLNEIKEYTEFYAAWKTDRIEQCEKIIDQPVANPLLPPKEKISSGVKYRQFLKSIEEGDINQIIDFVPVILPNNKYRNTEEGILKVILYLTEKQKNDHALLLSRAFRQYIDSSGHSESSELLFILDFTDGINYSKTEQYNSAEDCFDKIIALKPGNKHFSDFIFLKEFAILFKMFCEIAIVRSSREETSILLPSLKRNLGLFTDELLGSTLLKDYGHIMNGLLTYLNTDMLADEDVIFNLNDSSRRLQITRKTGFIREIISNLNWRKKVLEEFWNSLSSGDFKKTSQIYLNEIVPAYKDNIPFPVQLGSILTEWDLMSSETPVLLNRLSIIEQNSDIRIHEFIQKVRNYILEGDKIKYLTNLIRNKKYEEIIEFIQKTTWNDYDKGSMPVPVAIALLYAFHKLKKTEDATFFAQIIREAVGLAEWVKDYGRLLAGYVYFENRNFNQAVEAFGEISRHEILGHDVDKYWSASHFSIGLQMLDKKLEIIKDDSTDHKENSIDSFACAMSKLTGNVSNIELLPLFFHLALKNINSGNGTKAIETFQMIKEVIAPFERNEQILSYEFAADVGFMLCNSIIGSQAKQISDKSYLELTKKFRSEFTKDSVTVLTNTPNFPKEAIDLLKKLLNREYSDLTIFIDDINTVGGGKFSDLAPLAIRSLKHIPAKRLFFELVTCKMALIQYLKSSASDNKSNFRQDVTKKFKEYFQLLDMLYKVGENNDPVFLVLKALVAIKVENVSDLTEPFNWIEQANRLGLQSTKFNGYIYEYVKKIRQLSESRKEILQIIDNYLLSAETPEHIKHILMKNSDIRELYRINTNYSPEEIYVPTEQKSRYEVLAEKAKHFEEIFNKGNEKEFLKLQSELNDGISKIKKEEDSLLETEKKILALIIKKANS